MVIHVILYHGCSIVFKTTKAVFVVCMSLFGSRGGSSGGSGGAGAPPNAAGSMEPLLSPPPSPPYNFFDMNALQERLMLFRGGRKPLLTIILDPPLNL